MPSPWSLETSELAIPDIVYLNLIIQAKYLAFYTLIGKVIMLTNLQEYVTFVASFLWRLGLQPHQSALSPLTQHPSSSFLVIP